MLNIAGIVCALISFSQTASLPDSLNWSIKKLNSEYDNGQGRYISHRRFNAARQFVLVTCIWLATGSYVFSADEPGGPSKFGPDPQQYQRSVDRAIEYLQSHGQAEDGSFSSRIGVGVTALVTAGILRHGRSAGDPLAAKSLKYLEAPFNPMEASMQRMGCCPTTKPAWSSCV